MSTTWNSYPSDYRKKEVQFLLQAARTGECASIVGLSGAGKSNLTGFLFQRAFADLPGALVDCNRLGARSVPAFYALVRRSMGESTPTADEYAALEEALSVRLGAAPHLFCVVIDRFDALEADLLGPLAGGLRALRDTFKYQLTYITASRRALDPNSELAELFYANTLWLGPLSESDARWSMARFMERKGIPCSEWTEETFSAILKLSWGYPSFLRAICEAHAAGCSLEIEALKAHAAVQRRIAEFWSDRPSPEDLRSSGLAGHPLLGQDSEPQSAVPNELTAKEALLLAYFQAHPREICEKDDLIRAVWPEDRIFSEGIRDDSLAQIIRRLRRKIEPDPANPRTIRSVIGRGYRYMPVK